MNRKTPLIVVALSLLTAAGGIAFGIKANLEKNEALMQARQALPVPAEESADSEETPSTPLVPLKDIAEVSTNDVADLQEQLAARDAELQRLREELERRNNRRGRESFQDRMARMKEEDPERYAEFVQRRTERHEQMRYDQANRLALFMNMDTSGMTEEELANHNALVEKMSGLWEATADFDPENPPDRETMREFFGTFREIGELMDQERVVMFKQLGSEVGLSGTDAEDFATYAEEIIESTSFRPPWRGRGRRGN